MEETVNPAKKLADMLAPFVATEERIDGFAYASDGRVAVRVKLKEEELGGPGDGFQEDPVVAESVQKSVNGVFDKNLMNHKISVDGLDVELYKTFVQKSETASRSLETNPNKFDVFICPCCKNKLYLTDDGCLVDADEYDANHWKEIISKICVEVALREEEMLFPAEKVAEVIKLAALRNEPIKEVMVGDDYPMFLHGDGWDALICKSYWSKADIIHTLKEME